MREKIFPLSVASPGEEVVLVNIRGGRGWRRRLMEMGLSEGMKIKVIHSSPPGPCIIAIGNSRLFLGYGMAQRILVSDTNWDGKSDSPGRGK